jgi:hypothetical protein
MVAYMFLNLDLAYNIIIITFIHFIGRLVAMAMSYCPVILKIRGTFNTTHSISLWLLTSQY